MIWVRGGGGGGRFTSDEEVGLCWEELLGHRFPSG